MLLLIYPEAARSDLPEIRLNEAGDGTNLFRNLVLYPFFNRRKNDA